MYREQVLCDLKHDSEMYVDRPSMNNCQDPVLHVLEQVNRKLRIEILIQTAIQEKRWQTRTKTSNGLFVGKYKQNLRFLS